MAASICAPMRAELLDLAPTLLPIPAERVDTSRPLRGESGGVTPSPSRIPEVDTGDWRAEADEGLLAASCSAAAAAEAAQTGETGAATGFVTTSVEGEAVATAACAKISRAAISARRSADASVDSRTAGPSAPAHMASTVATALGSSGDTPARHATWGFRYRV
jgi:hypothetical protein